MSGDRRNGNGNGNGDVLHDSREYDSSERAETRPVEDPFAVLAKAIIALTSVVEERFDKIEKRMTERDERDDEREARMMKEFARIGQRVSLVDEHERDITGQHKAIETIAAAVNRVEQATPHRVWTRTIALVGAVSALLEKHRTLAAVVSVAVLVAISLFNAWHLTHPILPIHR